MIDAGRQGKKRTYSRTIEGAGGSVINKNNYYQTDTIEELNDKSSNEGVIGTYNGIAISIERNELLDKKGNKTSQGTGFGYGLGFGEKVWGQNTSTGIDFNWTKVINIW